MALPKECRLCGASIDHQVVATRHVYGGLPGQAFFKCERCDVYYQYPPIPEEEEERLYAVEFEKFMESRAGQARGWHDPAEHVSANADQVARRRKYLDKLFGQRGLDILEIGCSSGFMLYPLREMGHRVFGVEPSRVFGLFLRSQNVDFVESLDELFDGQKPKRHFDAVMHFFVLEHVRDPRTFLARNLQLVRDGGLLVMEIPNAADPLISVYDIPAFERFYWSVAHHWYFTPSALRYLLEQIEYRYEILFDQRYDLSNHLVWALTGRPGGMGKYSAVFGEELDAHYKQYWIDRRQCDTLIGVVWKVAR